MAARSFLVIFSNYTGNTLHRIFGNLDHGEWDIQPPIDIQPWATNIQWKSESNGIWTGTEGRVEYKLNDGGLLHIHWDNPYVGTNSYDAQAPDEYTINYSGGHGDDAILRIDFSTGVAVTVQALQDGQVISLRAKHSKKCLDVSGGVSGIENGAFVQQWDCSGADNQKWRLFDAGEGYFSLQAVHSGKCLDVAGGVGGIENGAIVQQWDCSGADNQKWKFTPVEGGRFYNLVAKHSGRCLDVAGGLSGTGNGAKVQQWDCSGADNQKWEIV